MIGNIYDRFEKVMSIKLKNMESIEGEILEYKSKNIKVGDTFLKISLDSKVLNIVASELKCNIECNIADLDIDKIKNTDTKRYTELKIYSKIITLYKILLKGRFSKYAIEYVGLDGILLRVDSNISIVGISELHDILSKLYDDISIYLVKCESIDSKNNSIRLSHVGLTETLNEFESMRL